MQVDLIDKNSVNFFINYSNYNHKEIMKQQILKNES